MWKQRIEINLGPRKIKGLAFSLCTAAERNFLLGADAIERGALESALVYFQRSYAADREFRDAPFCAGAVLLALGRADESRNWFFTLIRDCPDFFGAYTARFMPGFRLMLELREGLNYRILPRASDVAILIGILYQRENKLVEAKKLFQQTVQADPGNRLGSILLAYTLLLQGYPENALGVVTEQTHSLTDPLEALAMSIRGRAYLDMGKVEQALWLMEAAAHYPFKEKDAFHDTLCIEAAREFERQEYLKDAQELLMQVCEKEREYMGIETVRDAIVRLAARIDTLIKSGAGKRLKMSARHLAGKDTRKEKYWEINKRGEQGKT